jgi:hypothetical protein
LELHLIVFLFLLFYFSSFLFLVLLFFVSYSLVIVLDSVYCIDS